MPGGGYGALPLAADDGGARGAVPAGEAVRAMCLVGLYTFGGTQANIALFREAFVDQHGWLTAEEFAEVPQQLRQPGEWRDEASSGAAAFFMLPPPFALCLLLVEN